MALEPERHVALTIADGLGADGDPRLLSIMLENLVSNALKFTGRRPDPRIEFGSTDADSEEPTYFIRDNGAGFDMAFSAKLFGVFQLLHSPKEFDGTGIGLVTVQRIVRRHGGRIWAESEVDRGATFYFTLARKERGDEHIDSAGRG